MNKTGLPIVCLVMLNIVGWLLLPASSANADAPTKPSGELTCKQLTITSDDGNCSIVIKAGKDSVGMWMTRKDVKQYAYMYTSPQFTPYIALGDSASFDPLAFFMIGRTPYMQRRDYDGHLDHVYLGSLLPDPQKHSRITTNLK